MKFSSLLFSSGLLLTTLGFAEPCYQPFYQSCCPETHCSPCGEVWLFGDYLYWEASEDQLGYAIDLQGGITPVLNFFNGGESFVDETITVKEAKFQYKSGFRVGVGYESPCEWDARIFWTSLHEKTHSSVNDPDFGVIPTAFPITVIFNLSSSSTGPMFIMGANAKWKFHFDTIDLQFGKDFTPVCRFHVRPYVAVKGARINQTFNINYTGIFVDDSSGITVPLYVAVFKKNNFWGVGPMFGVDATWDFACNWSLWSQFSFGALYGKFHTTLTPSLQMSETLQKIDFMFKHHNRRLRPTMDGAIGLNWHLTTNYEWDFVVGAAYEVQYWWNQWQVPGSFELSLFNSYGSPQGDLMLQGLTVHAGIGF